MDQESERPLHRCVALVTGASSGIGAATARRLAADGAAVALLARRSDLLDDIAADIRSRGGRASVLHADIADRDQARGAVDRTISELGRLDIVVNNAGIMLLGPVLEAPPDEWERMIRVNLEGMLYVTSAALPYLVRGAETAARGVSDLVTISSTAGRVARPGGAVYSLTKFGAAAFSESLRQELIKQHVRVSVVEPGSVATELVTHVREGVRESAQSLLESIVPLSPDDVADAVSFIVTRDRRVAVNEVLIRAAEQTW